MPRRACLKNLLALATTAVLPAPTFAQPAFPAVRPRPLVFPRDHGAHPGFRTEWWYATGWLNTAAGREVGFQITFFRVRTGHGEDNPSRFAPRQLILAHAAIADPAFGRLRHAERSARADGRYAGYGEDTAHVWLGDWSLQLDGDTYRLAARGEDFAYRLELRANTLVLHGVGGFSQKTPDPLHASYYSSQPQLAVSGKLTLAGQRETVTGRAWLDHEWSSELLPAEAQGWDWVGLNLDDGSALMAFLMRDRQGKMLWAAATLQAAGRTQTFAPSEVQFTALRRWTSPRSSIVWPVSWRITVGARSFELQPLLDDQELDSRKSTGAIYWEGAMRASEAGRVVGRGYLEMTGYGEKIRVGR
jgi:predicted secreted hydrolase